jgi:hypothetical protein
MEDKRGRTEDRGQKTEDRGRQRKPSVAGDFLVAWGLPLMILQISAPQGRDSRVGSGPGTPAAGVRGKFAGLVQERVAVPRPLTPGTLERQPVGSVPVRAWPKTPHGVTMNRRTDLAPTSGSVPRDLCHLLRNYPVGCHGYARVAMSSSRVQHAYASVSMAPGKGRLVSFIYPPHGGLGTRKGGVEPGRFFSASLLLARSDKSPRHARFARRETLALRPILPDTRAYVRMCRTTGARPGSAGTTTPWRP